MLIFKNHYKIKMMIGMKLCKWNIANTILNFYYLKQNQNIL